MNTLNYIGCKNKLSSTLLDIFNKNIPDLTNIKQRSRDKIINAKSCVYI